MMFILYFECVLDYINDSENSCSFRTGNSETWYISKFEYILKFFSSLTLSSKNRARFLIEFSYSQFSLLFLFSLPEPHRTLIKFFSQNSEKLLDRNLR